MRRALRAEEVRDAVIRFQMALSFDCHDFKSDSAVETRYLGTAQRFQDRALKQFRNEWISTWEKPWYLMETETLQLYRLLLDTNGLFSYPFMVYNQNSWENFRDFISCCHADPRMSLVSSENLYWACDWLARRSFRADIFWGRASERQRYPNRL
jgi:hypothetical protein